MIPTIANECSQFITESTGRYVVKNLPKKYQGFSKVKVRVGKTKDKISENFNIAFKDRSYKIHERAIFAYTNINLLTNENDKEPFYIFPIDGYKILYNPEVKNLQTAYESIEIDNDLMTDVLSMSYDSGELSEVISHQCEIIFYSIPYYYAIRSSLVDDYHAFFTNNE